MTESEVEDIIGHRPGDLYAIDAGNEIRGKKAVVTLKGWGLRPDAPPRGNNPAPDDDEQLAYTRTWRGRCHILEVSFDSDGKVVGCVLRWSERYFLEVD